MPNSVWAAAGRSVYGFDLRASEGLLIREPSLTYHDVCPGGEDGDDEISALHVQPKDGSVVCCADDTGDIHLFEVTARGGQGEAESPRDSEPGSAAGETAEPERASRTVHLKRGAMLRGGHGSVCTAALFRRNFPTNIISGALDCSLAFWDLTKPKRLWHGSVEILDESAAWGRAGGGAERRASTRRWCTASP